MFQRFCVSILVCLAVLLMGQPAAAQRGSGGFLPTPAGPTDLTLLQRAEVQKELKLSDEQVKQLAEIEAKRAAVLNDNRPGSAPERTKMRNEANQTAREAAQKLLKPEQAGRLNQILAQEQQRQLGEVPFLRSETVKQGLNLTPEQTEKMDAIVKDEAEAMRKAVLSGEPAATIEAKLQAARKDTQNHLLAVLTEAQRKGLKDLLGEPFALPALTRGGPPGFDRGGPPGGFPGPGGDRGTFPLGRAIDLGTLTTLSPTLVNIEDVQKELKLTAEQIKKVTSATGRFGAVPADVETILEAGQVARLRQLRLQQADRTGGPAYALRFREVIEALQPTDEQRTKLRPLAEEAYRQGVTRTWSARDGAAVSEEFRKKADKALAEVLTAEQQKKLTALYGEPFKGSLTVTFAGPPRGELGTLTNLTAGLLSDEAVQKELKLTEEQIKKVADLTSRRGSVTLPDEIGKVLNADQVTRLRQLRMQQMDRIAGPAYLLLFREVIEVLEPTDEQKKQLQPVVQEAYAVQSFRSDDTALSEEARKKAQQRLDDVLSAVQRKKLTGMLGDPYSGKLALRPAGTPLPGTGGRSSTTRGRGFGGPAPVSPTLRYLTSPDVQAELKLTKEQTEKVQAIEAKRAEALKDSGTTTAAQRTRKVADADAVAEKAVAEVLDANQAKRLKQIALQQRPVVQLSGLAAASGNSIFLTADIAGELGIGVAQQEKVRSAVDEGEKVYQLMQRQNWDRGAAPVVEFQAALTEKVLALLTKEQQAKWKELLGEPFKGQIGPVRRP